MDHLICFDCLTDPDATPGSDETPAVTMHEGTALCAGHARDAARTAAERQEFIDGLTWPASRGGYARRPSGY